MNIFNKFKELHKIIKICLIYYGIAFGTFYTKMYQSSKKTLNEYRKYKKNNDYYVLIKDERHAIINDRNKYKSKIIWKSLLWPLLIHDTIYKYILLQLNKEKPIEIQKID